MKIAVFGKSGQVATELTRRDYPGTSITAIGREHADFTDPAQVCATAKSLNVDAIINAVAYTAVDKAEEDRDTAQMVNAVTVDALARHAAKRCIPFLHISTDYIFDGTGTHARKPDDPTGPLGVYGATKLGGEHAVRAAGGPHAILRTSWVFSAHGANFVKTMLRLSKTHDQLTIVNDQIGGPTPAAAIADAIIDLARGIASGGPSGTYHFSGAPDVSWADFAREVFRQANLNVAVDDIPTTDYPTPARRPLNSRLDCESLARDYGIQRPDWKAGLTDVLKELT